MFKGFGATKDFLIDRGSQNPTIDDAPENSPYQERSGLGSYRGVGIRGLGALGVNIDPVTGIDLDSIGVTCTNGICVDNQFGDTFVDPVDVATSAGVGLAAGYFVNPIVGAVAAYMFWLNTPSGKKPGTIHSQG